MYARQDNIRHSSYSEMDLNARLNANDNKGKKDILADKQMIRKLNACSTHFSLECPKWVLANSADSDPTSQNAASDLGLQCLPKD